MAGVFKVDDCLENFNKSAAEGWDLMPLADVNSSTNRFSTTKFSKVLNGNPASSLLLLETLLLNELGVVVF